MPFTFECPYCGELIASPDDLEYIRSHKLCPECDASFEDDDLEDLLPEDDELIGEDEDELEYDDTDDDEPDTEAVDDDDGDFDDEDLEEEE